MKYVPNLIPEHSRVTIPAVKSAARSGPKSKIATIISYFCSGLFFIGAVATIVLRFWEGFIFSILGFSILPQGHRWIESNLKFKFTWPIKTVFIVFLAVALIPISDTYNRKYEAIKAKEVADKERIVEEERVARLAAERKEKQRIDSLNFYTKKADEKIGLRQYKAGLKFINSALQFAESKNELIEKRAEVNLKTNQIEEAIADYSTLIAGNVNARDNYYYRAVCYQKINRKLDAVRDLKQAIDLGNVNAEKLYNRINPLRRRLTGYLTLCCDGSTTSRKGRGTCSGHDGVCDWNHPVYEEYREY